MEKINVPECIALEALEIGRRTAEKLDHCPPTMFLMRRGSPDYSKAILLDQPSDYAEIAERHGAGAVVLVWSHSLIDAEMQPELKLTRIYAGLVNAKGQVLSAAKRQRWSDQANWSVPSTTNEILPLVPVQWVM